jgi:CBS domain-containing protein
MQMQTGHETPNTLANTTAALTTAERIGAFVADRPCLRVAADCPVDTILNIMSHTGRRVAGVVNPDRSLRGFVTRSGIFGKLVFDADFTIQTGIVRAMTAEDVMIPNPAFLPSELGTADALALMAEHGFQYMPVLGEDARLIGIADLRDLALGEQEACRQTVTEKDNLLSYLMHHETYGLCGTIDQSNRSV